ncbi:FAD-binding oxidoreductase [Desulfoluna limicola]|nr:FAD-binding oxidoreductase [Desulfoluna limicola]
MERALYSRDLAPVPSLVVESLFRTMPDLVVRPANDDEIADVMRTAHRKSIPVTPRAGGSTVYFNSVPVKGGIVMDLNLIQGVVDLNENAMTVKVRAATTFEALESWLNKHGMACQSMPSSAPVATVGGWLNTMGYGIGSLKYGSLASQVRSIDVVLPDGRKKHLTRVSNPSIRDYGGSDGTLGIVTQIELDVRKQSPMAHYLVHVQDARQTGAVMNALCSRGTLPYHMHFADAPYLHSLGALGYSLGNIADGSLVAVDFEGAESELARAKCSVEDVVGSNADLSLLPEDMADMEWNERFRAIRIKRGGPSLLGAEMTLPTFRLTVYLDDIRESGKRFGFEPLIYGHACPNHHVTVMTVFTADETKTLPYIINLSLVKKIHDAGRRNGGVPYGTGLWNTPYLHRIVEKKELENMRKLKSNVDPSGIMNPGKTYRAPFLFNRPGFAIGNNVLAEVRRLVRIKG